MANELTGYRVLVIEDEYFLAAEIEDVLVEAGAVVVGPLARVDESLEQVKNDGFDIAVVDINLGGFASYAVADALGEQGVPFLFATAYTPAEIPIQYRAQPVLEKPYNAAKLLKAVVELTRLAQAGNDRLGQFAPTREDAERG